MSAPSRRLRVVRQWIQKAENDLDVAETRLAARLPDPHSVGLTPIERRRLTRYATIMRYPGDYDPITLDEARAAVEIARRARANLRGQLPAELCGP